MTENIKRKSNGNKILEILKNYKLLGRSYLWLLVFSSISYFGVLGYPFITKKLVQGVETQIGMENMLIVFTIGTIYILVVQIMAYIRDGYGDKYFSLLSNKLTLKYRNFLSKKSVVLQLNRNVLFLAK